MTGRVISIAAVAMAAAVVLAACGDSDDAAAAPASAATTGAPSTTDVRDPVDSTTTTGTSDTTTPTVPATVPDGRTTVVAQITEPWPTDWEQRTIDLAELKVGIPVLDPRDRITPLDSPAYETVEAADGWLVDREIGVMLELEGSAFFYPLRILTSHEVVNDETGGLPFVVTYCPLCNTAAAFDRRVDEAVLRFGVSGLLRNSDLVMWDDHTVSLWQQISGEGIAGTFAGTQLEFLPTATVRWADFKAQHPEGEVLSQDTGFGFNYGSNSYVGYSNQARPFASFFDGEIDDRFPALSRVVGVRVGDATKAYPFSVMEEARAVDDELGSEPIAVWWAPTGAADNFDGNRVGEGVAIGTGIAFSRDVDGHVLTFAANGDASFVDNETGSTWSLFGEAIAGPLTGSQLQLALHQNEFWFAWRAFNPEAPVYEG